MNDLDASTIESMDYSDQNTAPTILGALINITETSTVSQDVLIGEEMTKLTGGSGHITDFLRTQNNLSIWMNIIHGDHWESKSHDRICSDHFEGGISIFELLSSIACCEY